MKSVKTSEGKESALPLYYIETIFKNLLKRIEIKLIFLIQALINVKCRRVLPHDSDESLATPLSQFAPRNYLKKIHLNIKLRLDT